MFQLLAHKRLNFYQFLWVIPLNWRTIGFDQTHTLLPPSHNPSSPLFPSCQSVSPQFTLLMELSDYADFSCTLLLPTPSLFDTVSTSTSVTDWTMRHMTAVQTGDKNKIRHVIQCEEVSGNGCPSPHRHTYPPSTPQPILIVNIWSAFSTAVEWCLRCCVHPVPA